MHNSVAARPGIFALLKALRAGTTAAATEPAEKRCVFQ
jgi:hypothetical protein